MRSDSVCRVRIYMGGRILVLEKQAREISEDCGSRFLESFSAMPDKDSRPQAEFMLVKGVQANTANSGGI